MKDIKEIVEKQREYFNTGKTLPFKARQSALKMLGDTIKENEAQITNALKFDLNKCAFESYMAEIGMVLSEIGYLQKHLSSFMRKKTVVTPLAQFCAKSYTVSEPYGVCLVMSPWNYPFMLAIEPLVGAICAGNCVVVKPSNYAPNTSHIIAKIIEKCFADNFVAVIEGGREQNAALLDERWDYIFFTGGVTVGKLVLSKAANFVTPVTLELGGKSPCIVTESANLKLAARRIVFGKFLNAGQTCVAPDYLLVDEKVKAQLLQHIKAEIVSQYGEKPLENDKLPKIINEKHYLRLQSLMANMEVFAGGKFENGRIEPTVLDNVKATDGVMCEEIFGPILPVLTFKNIGEVVDFVKMREKPLACYMFTNDKADMKIFNETLSFGGGCINDTIIHLATSRMGFGGVGGSGMGSYHGKYSFKTFSHEKSIVKKYNFIDLPVRYQPDNSLKNKMLRLFLK